MVLGLYFVVPQIEDTKQYPNWQPSFRQKKVALRSENCPLLFGLFLGKTVFFHVTLPALERESNKAHGLNYVTLWHVNALFS
jgi:hypothetical protein